MGRFGPHFGRFGSLASFSRLRPTISPNSTNFGARSGRFFARTWPTSTKSCRAWPNSAQLCSKAAKFGHVLADSQMHDQPSDASWSTFRQLLGSRGARRARRARFRRAWRATLRQLSATLGLLDLSGSGVQPSQLLITPAVAFWRPFGGPERRPCGLFAQGRSGVLNIAQKPTRGSRCDMGPPGPEVHPVVLARHPKPLWPSHLEAFVALASRSREDLSYFPSTMGSLAHPATCLAPASPRSVFHPNLATFCSILAYFSRFRLCVCLHV